MAFGLRRAKVLVYLSVQLVSKISNVCNPDPSTLQTDRQTDRQTTCDLNTALCTKVHRAVKTTSLHTDKKAELLQRWPRDAPYVWVPWKISGVPEYTPTATFPEIFNGLLFRPTSLYINVRTEFEIRSFTRSWDNRNIWAAPGYAHTPFFSKILMGFCSDGLCESANILAKLEIRSISCFWDNSDWSFGWWLWTPILGESRP